MGMSIFMRIMMTVIVPLWTYSSAGNNDSDNHEEVCRKIGIMPPCFRIPIAVEEHDGVPGVIVPTDYLQQVELAASRNPSFVRLSRIAGQAGNDISHVMLKQEELDRRVDRLRLQIGDVARNHFCCLTGFAVVICGVVCWAQRKNKG